MGECSFHFSEFFNHSLRMTMSGINDDSVSTSVYQCLRTVECIYRNTNTSCNTQPSLLVLASHRFVLGFRYVLVCNQSYQVVVFIHHWQFLNLVFLQYLCGGSQISLLMRGHKIFVCHHVINLPIQSTLESQVSIGNDTHQAIILVNHGNTTDVIVAHHVKRIFHGTSHANSYWVVNHTVLSTFHDSHLTCLLFDGHVFMNHANTTFACNGNRHRRLRYRIHSGSNERYVQYDIAGKLGCQLYRLG